MGLHYLLWEFKHVHGKFCNVKVGEFYFSLPEEILCVTYLDIISIYLYGLIDVWK
jgi:hypothetical protein